MEGPCTPELAGLTRFGRAPVVRPDDLHPHPRQWPALGLGP
ncbi:hypothetical protein [Nonomuraea lactucae]|nr:hypothetical protein [Nonomuraea lactucae]